MSIKLFVNVKRIINIFLGTQFFGDPKNKHFNFRKGKIYLTTHTYVY